jgi:hypothetical protein
MFRGPQDAPDAGRYAAVLGGSSTFGRGVTDPYPALVQAATGIPMMNLGAMHAGPDVYLGNPDLLTVIARAEFALVQVTGAERVSNPYYSVHGRRNDRFLAARPPLQALFPEVDFTEIHFVRHLLHHLDEVDADRFAVVARALKATWVTRMQHLLVHLPLRRRLLWLADSPPPDRADVLGSGPLLVDVDMLARLAPLAGPVIVVRPGPAAGRSDASEAGTPGLPGPAAHRDIAAALLPEIAALPRRSIASPLILRQADAVR